MIMSGKKKWVMKKNKAYHSSDYTYQNGEQILIDANIWLYLQPPASKPQSKFSASYSTALKKLLEAQAEPIIETLILSEYINRYFRMEYDAIWRKEYERFKDFRLSKDFLSIARSAVAEVRHILTLASIEDTTLITMNLEHILDGTLSGTYDFNDGVLIELCRLNGWKFLTNDGDMTSGGIDVLTANRKLLKSCP